METPDPLTEQLKASIDFENYKRISQGSVDALALEIVELKRKLHEMTIAMMTARYAMENSTVQMEYMEEAHIERNLDSTADAIAHNNRAIYEINKLIN